MAYAALVSLAQTADLILNHDKYSLSVDERENIKSIHEYVNFLQSFLEDFPEKANRLEGKIRDVANETEDVIEEFMWKQIWMSSRTVELPRVEFENQLAEVTEKIGLIAGEMMDDRCGQLPAAISSPRLGPTGKNDKVIGLDDDLMAIKGRLCGESPYLQVIPIVGMGGIGKTTLARSAYDDPLMIEYFQIRAWVTVSQNYSAQEILSGLLDSMKLSDKKMSGQKNELPVDQIVYRSLKYRRYLIVMDDVWSTEAWDDVKYIFPDDVNGSRIMLTTRLLNVPAAYSDSSSPPHEMRFMNGNQSWNLLKQKVFTNGQDCPPELEDIGKEIARRCGGLPLALVLVAGILSTVKIPASWEKIAGNVNLVVDWQIEKILSLSYTNLPHHLRPCFLFIGCFPEDYKIYVSRLIKLWVAEGFLRRQDEYKSLEEKAEEYLEDLVKRSLVLVTGRKSNGKIKSCALHDLVRDLCIRKAEEEKFLLHITDRCVPPESIGNMRRISISHPDLIYLGPSIRAIVRFRLVDCSSSLAFVGSFRLLRVLDMATNYPRSLPSQLFELFHLRYLALGSPDEIPSAISNLKNLQTFIINPSRDRVSYSYLLLDIWRMPQLRHLVCPYCVLLDPADESTPPLENLQTLSGVTNFACSERVLKMIPNLKKLGIIYLENQECHLDNLIHLHQLEKLNVTKHQIFSWRGKNPAFPATLKKLTLVGGGLPWEDMTIVGSLPNLEVLKLKGFACDGDTWETTDEEFPQLKFLQILGSDLQYWITEACPFPRLERLVLHYCKNLSEIPNDIGEIPTLELIEVDSQNESLVESAKQIQDYQQSYGNDALQVRCIHLDQEFQALLEKYRKS